MTQELFDQLPAVLTSYQVCSIGGLDRRELAAEVRAGQIQTFQPCHVRKGCRAARPKYLKSSVAKRFGFRL